MLDDIVLGGIHEEEGWSWSYSQPEDERTTPNSTETLEKNPVVVVNKKDNTSIKHAESKAINQFGKAKKATTIDSREFFNNNTTPSTPTPAEGE
jgi:hypothetical protein